MSAAYPPERSPLARRGEFKMPAAWAFAPAACHVEACNLIADLTGYCPEHQPPETPMTEPTSDPAAHLPPPAATPDTSEPHPEQPDNDKPPTDPGLRKAWERARTSTSSDATLRGIPDPPATTFHLLGRTVWFRSRTGRWTAPAIITATPDSLYPPNVEAGHVPPLTGDDYVHLTVLTPGVQGHASTETAETHPDLVDPDRPNKPAGGSFAEWDIPFWPVPGGPFRFEDQEPGTWTWPL